MLLPDGSKREYQVCEDSEEERDSLGNEETTQAVGVDVLSGTFPWYAGGMSSCSTDEVGPWSLRL